MVCSRIHEGGQKMTILGSGGPPKCSEVVADSQCSLSTVSFFYTLASPGPGSIGSMPQGIRERSLFTSGGSGGNLKITGSLSNLTLRTSPDSMTPPIGGGMDSMTPPIRGGLDSM